MTCYLWRAEQTEPGCEGKRFALTETEDAPARIATTSAAEGLVHAESLYGEWELLGTVNGTCYSNRYGESLVELERGSSGGVSLASAQLSADDVYRLGTYLKVNAFRGRPTGEQAFVRGTE